MRNKDKTNGVSGQNHDSENSIISDFTVGKKVPGQLTTSGGILKSISNGHFTISEAT